MKNLTYFDDLFFSFFAWTFSHASILDSTLWMRWNRYWMLLNLAHLSVWRFLTEILLCISSVHARKDSKWKVQTNSKIHFSFLLCGRKYILITLILSGTYMIVWIVHFAFLLHLFPVFLNNHLLHPSSIQCRGSNPQPLGHKFYLIWRLAVV